MKKLMGALVLAVCGILTVSAKPVWTGAVFTKSDFVPMDAADNIAYGRNGAYTDGKLEKANQTNWSGKTFSITFDGAKDIYELVTYSWWSDGGRDGYSVASVSVKYDGDAAYTKLDVEPSSTVNGGTGSVRFSIKDDADAPLARNIIAIQFTLDNLENTWIGVGEFEVRGCETTIYDLAKATVTFDPLFGTADGTDQTPAYLVTKEDGTVLTDGFTASWDKEELVDEGVYTLTLTPEEGSDYKPGSPLVAQYRIWPENPLPTWECVQPSSPFVPMDQEENVAFGRNGKVTNGVLNKDDSTAQYVGDYTISFDGPKDIYELKVYSAWDGGRDGFGIDKVSVQYYGETGYTQLTDVPAFDVDKGWGSQCEWLKIREDLPLAKNVTAIRIHFSRCDANWIGLGEIEVRGCETAVYDLDRAVITFDPEYVCYDGKERKPEVTVAKEDGTVLTDGIVLTWDPAEMVNAGIYTLTVSPAAGSAFKGSKTVSYRIWPAGGTGDPDTAPVTYTWKGGETGRWNFVPSWKSSAIECFGYPNSKSFATVSFPGGTTVTVDGEGGSYSIAGMGLSTGANVLLTNMAITCNGDVSAMGGRLVLDGVALSAGTVIVRGGCSYVFRNGAGLTYGILYRAYDDAGGTVAVLDGASELREFCNNRNSPVVLAVTNGVAKFSQGSSRWQIQNNATVDLYDGAFQCSWVPNGKMTQSFVWKVDCLTLPESASAAITFWNAGAYKTFLDENGIVASKIKVAYDRAFAEKGKMMWTPIIRFNVPAAEQSDALDEALKSMVEFEGTRELNSSLVRVEHAGDVVTVWAKASPPSGLLVIIR